MTKKKLEFHSLFFQHSIVADNLFLKISPSICGRYRERERHTPLESCRNVVGRWLKKYGRRFFNSDKKSFPIFFHMP